MHAGEVRLCGAHFAHHGNVLLELRLDRAKGERAQFLPTFVGLLTPDLKKQLRDLLESEADL